MLTSDVTEFRKVPAIIALMAQVAGSSVRVYIVETTAVVTDSSGATSVLNAMVPGFLLPTCWHAGTGNTTRQTK